MTTERDTPYVWVTWITGLLSGDSHCEWAAWFKAHHSDYQKPPSNLNLTVWKAQHGAMVRERARKLRESGYSVYVENQNKFTYTGSNGIKLSGVPDIVATKDTDALVVDCKTGKERGSDTMQVMVYMLMLPRTHNACMGRTLRGEVEYKDRAVGIGAHELTDGIKKLMRNVIWGVGGSVVQKKVPSCEECAFCGIGTLDCAERVEAAAQPEVVDTEGGVF
jgi:hypothetical protein